MATRLEMLKAQAKEAGYQVDDTTEAVMPADYPYLKAYLFHELNIARPDFSDVALALAGISEATEDGDVEEGSNVVGEAVVGEATVEDEVVEENITDPEQQEELQ